MELLASSDQGLQAPPYTWPLREAQRFPLCTAGQQRSPVSNVQTERQFHPAATNFPGNVFDSSEKITEQMSAPLNFFKFIRFSVKLSKTL